MKRVTLWMCVALLTFSTGIACVVLWFLDRQSTKPQSDAASASLTSETEPLEVKFCHLSTVPEEFEGKIIRVQATYAMGIHGETLRDKSCSGAGTQIWVNVPPTMREEVERAMERAYETKDISGPLSMVVIGRFGKNRPSLESDSLADNAPHRFELMRIENAVRPR